ncbi:MAG: hypothetical protein V3U37_01285 [Nitrospinaceae bacterium]
MKPSSPKGTDADRMKGYLGKIATGPKMSRDLTEEEAEDALTLVLNGAVSPVRAAIFLIAARMKLETVPENIGYWRALQKTTVQHSLPFEKLLQVADPFDGFNRTPYFGFYAIPVIAEMGLPAYGHSTLAMPPKHGITFEEILINHYRVPEEDDGERRIALLKEFRFGYLSARHTNPPLENLRDLRVEIVKRTMLSTLEKMLMPVYAEGGGNYLATGYFHKGYEVSMMAVAGLSAFDKTLVGNGLEGATLYGVHKPAHVFINDEEIESEEIKLTLEESFNAPTADLIKGTYQELKQEKPQLKTVAETGEAALKNNSGPAAPLIACQAGTLCHLMGLHPDPQEGFDAAQEILKKGQCREQLMRYIEKCT